MIGVVFCLPTSYVNHPIHLPGHSDAKEKDQCECKTAASISNNYFIYFSRIPIELTFKDNDSIATDAKVCAD